jgi:hypothetical protein
MGDDDVGPPNHIEDERRESACRNTKYQYKVGKRNEN